jgi:ketosteroid isomerase-like protein
MSEENVQIVRRLNEAVNRGDVATVIEVLDPGFEWWDREDDPGATVHRGPAGFGQHFADLGTDVELRVQVKEYIDAGDYVVTPVRLHGRGKASGTPFEEYEVHVIRLRDGKVTELREFRTKAQALAAAGLAE